MASIRTDIERRATAGEPVDRHEHSLGRIYEPGHLRRAATPIQPQQALPRSMPPHAGAPEASTWSTRSAASMNDVDTDQHRHTLAGEEGPLSDTGTHPDHVHNADERTAKGP
ncbi:hypothetical protein [Intrasporangium sp.]|uniref:hypothetical protein n=1 Tax=Intrasporangium sp. TaxID=1925024 RepID=UPI00293BD92B|nr:hypothetical protein [Intrasporangium sp.]